MKKYLFLCAGLLVAGYNLSFAADVGGITSGGPAVGITLPSGRKVDAYLLESNYSMGDKIGQVFVYEFSGGIYRPFFMPEGSLEGKIVYNDEQLRELYENNAVYKKHIDELPDEGGLLSGSFRRGLLEGMGLREDPPGTPDASEFLSRNYVIGGSILLAAIVTALVTYYYRYGKKDKKKTSEADDSEEREKDEREGASE